MPKNVFEVYIHKSENSHQPIHIMSCLTVEQKRHYRADQHMIRGR